METNQVDQTTVLLKALLMKAVNFGPTLLLAVATLMGGFWLIGKITKVTNTTMDKKGVDVTITPFLSSILSITLKMMLLLSVASMFGVETTSFIAIFTALAFALGTALSGSIGHFASGVMLLMFKPYRVGDLVTLAGQTGTVEAVQIFNTILRTQQNKVIIVPNGNVTSDVITNISGQGTLRLDINLLLGPDADIDKARETILAVMEANPNVLRDPAPEVWVSDIVYGHIRLVVCPWVKSTDYWPVYYYMQENMKKGLDKAGVSFPKINDIGIDLH